MLNCASSLGLGKLLKETEIEASWLERESVFKKVMRVGVLILRRKQVSVFTLLTDFHQ